MRSAERQLSTPAPCEQARDELFSHILRCGVLEATPEHQKEWFDDTMLYLAERYDALDEQQDRKSTRLNSSHANTSYAVFCLKKKNIESQRGNARQQDARRVS